MIWKCTLLNFARHKVKVVELGGDYPPILVAVPVTPKRMGVNELLAPGPPTFHQDETLFFRLVRVDVERREAEYVEDWATDVMVASGA